MDYHNKVSHPANVEFAERAGSINLEPFANASTMEVVVTRKGIQLYTIYISRQADATLLESNKF